MFRRNKLSHSLSVHGPKTEAASSSETSARTQNNPLRYVPEDNSVLGHELQKI